MAIEFWRLCIDFGLVILIWLVQLVAYPAFYFMEPAQLKVWHSRYAFRIALVVIPLMLSQLVIGMYMMWGGGVLNYLIGLGILLVWLLTFGVFAPLHRKLAMEVPNGSVLDKLLKWNWWRTFMWTAIFLLGLADILYDQPIL